MYKKQKTIQVNVEDRKVIVPFKNLPENKDRMFIVMNDTTEGEEVDDGVLVAYSDNNVEKVTILYDKKEDTVSPVVDAIKAIPETVIPEADYSSIESALKNVEDAIFATESDDTDLSPLVEAVDRVRQAVDSKEIPEGEDYTGLLNEIADKIPDATDMSEVVSSIRELIDKVEALPSPIPDSLISDGRLKVEVDRIGGGGAGASQYTKIAGIDTPDDTLSTTDPLDNGETYTSAWVDTKGHSGVKLAVKTDQDGTYTVQWSPDGVNADSTLTRYYRTAQIEPPHKFENMRRYVRVTFTNNSGSNQTYLRFQVMLTNSSGLLNIPIDGTMSQDYDAIATRPTEYNSEVALGRRQGHSLWNKFGYNNDVDVGTEVIASFGGTFTPLTTATTLTIASSSTADDGDPAGTGCNSIVVYGIDANRDEQTEVITLNGTTNVVTTSTWLGINRVAIHLCGSGQVNAGTITITATTGGSTMAEMPAGEGVTQQCIFHVPRNTQFITEWLRVNTLKQAAQDPAVTVKFWVFSPISNGKQEVYKVDIDTAVTNDISEDPNLPFPITEQCVVWLEATTDKADTIINARFSGILVRDVDA